MIATCRPLSSIAIGGAAQVAGPGQDDVLELLHRRGLHRRGDPLAALVDLAQRRDAQRIGAQILVEDRHGHLHPLGRGVAGSRTSR